MKEGENPQSIDLITMDLWVQVYDLKMGFMSERIITEVGNSIGRPEKFCSRLFETPEAEITKPYGHWMRSPPRKHVKPIRSKWLCNQMDEGGRSIKFQFQNGEGSSSHILHVTPPNQGSFTLGEISGDNIISKIQTGGNAGITPFLVNREEITPTRQRKESIIIETKKTEDRWGNGQE
ncbi:hypothetical protein AgCh_005665 [Apium graveolens]